MNQRVRAAPPEGHKTAAASSGAAHDARGSAMLIVDMVSCWDFPDGEKLLAHALRITPAIAALKKRCRRACVPVIYANDNRGRWQSDFSHLVEASLRCGGDVADITQALRPQEDDYFVLKPKQSAFFCTPLELLLQHLGVRRLVVCGVASDQCVVTTAIEARMRDLDVVVPRDCSASQTAARHAAVLAQLTEAHKLSITTGARLGLHHHGARQANTATTLRGAGS